MKRDQRLRRRADFLRARALAPHVLKHPLLVLYAAPNDLPQSRLGITVSRRVGKAAVRNRVRRRIREAVRRRLADITAGRDLVFVARPASARAGWGEIRDAVERTIARGGLWIKAEDAARATPTAQANV